MIETLRHTEAFEYYYILGGKATDKNCSKVGVKFGVSCKTIWNWYKKYNWKGKVEQRNIENSKRLSKKIDNLIVNSKADYRAEIKAQMDIIKTLLNEVIQDFKNDKVIKINTIKELKKVIECYTKLCKLDLLLMREATNEKDVVINIIGEDD